MDTIIIYAIMLFFLALIIGILIAIVYFLFRFPKNTLLVGIFIISIFVLGYKYIERQHRMSFVPDALYVSKIIYANEESWGFGPGGNETGVIVYELPDNIAKEIQQVGIGYLTKIHQQPKSGCYWCGIYDNWHQTPILRSPYWEYDTERESNTSTAELGNYLNKYGYGISIDPIIEDEINRAISKSGSYFAYGRIGVLIVIPDIQKVVYAYAG
jgi:energy-coupling factor transporter transmembrane protein EcfT